MPSQMCDEITYATVEVWKCISYYTSHFIMGVISDD